MFTLRSIAEGYAEDIRGDYVTLEDAREAAWEYADGASEVIYTGKAWDLVASNRAACEDAIADIGLDVGDVFARDGLDAVISVLAFAGLYAAICDILAEYVWDDE